jgi:hypothetical protein
MALVNGPIQYYLDILSRWPTSIALANQFLIYFNFDSVPAIRNSAAKYISALDASEWSLSQKTIDSLLDRKFHNIDKRVGCVFARGITLPQERAGVVRQGIRYGAHIAPIVATNREPGLNFTCNFLETNASFVDLVIRPWIVLTSHYGLIARSPLSRKSVKCNYVDVIQYAKSGMSSAPFIRKIVRFHGVVPTDTGSYSIAHTEDGLSNRSATFAFNTYSVLEVHTQGMVNS